MDKGLAKLLHVLHVILHREGERNRVRVIGMMMVVLAKESIRSGTDSKVAAAQTTYHVAGAKVLWLARKAYIIS